MFKLVDVLDHNLVQNFSHSLVNSTDQLDEQFHQSILNITEIDLQTAITDFFHRPDALEVAQALDIADHHIQSLQTSHDLKQTPIIHHTAKILAFCLAVETNSLDQVNVADCLADYPM